MNPILQTITIISASIAISIAVALYLTGILYSGPLDNYDKYCFSQGFDSHPAVGEPTVKTYHNQLYIKCIKEEYSPQTLSFNIVEAWFLYDADKLIPIELR